MTSRRNRRSDSSAPQKIVRVAARRVFQRTDKPDRSVILTLGIPQPVPGSDWGCAVQITGLTRELSRPRYVFGVDALQALELALQYAKVTLETSGYELRWLHATADLGLPRILPMLPQPFQERLERVVDREVLRFYAAAKGNAIKRRCDSAPQAVVSHDANNSSST